MCTILTLYIVASPGRRRQRYTVSAMFTWGDFFTNNTSTVFTTFAPFNVPVLAPCVYCVSIPFISFLKPAFPWLWSRRCATHGPSDFLISFSHHWKQGTVASNLAWNIYTIFLSLCWQRKAAVLLPDSVAGGENSVLLWDGCCSRGTFCVARRQRLGW